MMGDQAFDAKNSKILSAPAPLATSGDGSETSFMYELTMALVSVPREEQNKTKTRTAIPDAHVSAFAMAGCCAAQLLFVSVFLFVCATVQLCNCVIVFLCVLTRGRIMSSCPPRPPPSLSSVAHL